MDIQIAEGLPCLPEDLLLEHKAGKVLFFVGSGASIPSGLSNFKDLTLQILKELYISVHASCIKLEDGVAIEKAVEDLLPTEHYVVQAYKDKQYDTCLGIIEKMFWDENEGYDQNPLVASIMRWFPKTRQ